MPRQGFDRTLLTLFASADAGPADGSFVPGGRQARRRMPSAGPGWQVVAQMDSSGPAQGRRVNDLSTTSCKIGLGLLSVSS